MMTRTRKTDTIEEDQITRVCFNDSEKNFTGEIKPRVTPGLTPAWFGDTPFEHPLSHNTPYQPPASRPQGNTPSKELRPRSAYLAIDLESTFLCVFSVCYYFIIT